MTKYWLDSSALITASRSGYGFDLVPQFWDWLHHQCQNGTVYSSDMVYHELVDHYDDELAGWAKSSRALGLFQEPDSKVQSTYIEIADYVKQRYRHYHAREFLKGADGWIIAHAKTYGGAVVHFEARVGDRRPEAKIPNVCIHFNVDQFDLWTMIRELGGSFGTSI